MDIKRPTRSSCRSRRDQGEASKIGSLVWHKGILRRANPARPATARIGCIRVGVASLANLQVPLWDRFEAEIIETIQNYRLPSIELSRDTSREAVCMVFEKVNQAGKPLDAFELVTASFASDQLDLREDWYGRRERLSKHTLLKELEGTDFLQAVTLLWLHRRPATDRGHYVGCKRRDVLDLNAADYRAVAGVVETGFHALPA